MRSDFTLLLDILRAARRIALYVDGMEIETISSDLRTQDAVQNRVPIMGEEASKVTREFKQQHPEVSWAKIVQLRNFYVHAYHSVDAQRLWQTVQSVIMDVERKLPTILPQDVDQA